VGKTPADLRDPQVVDLLRLSIRTKAGAPNRKLAIRRLVRSIA
jgi:hypothetical protein